VQTCDFCQETAPVDTLRQVDGLACCPRCAGGDLDAAFAAHDYRAEQRFEEHHRGESSGDPYMVQLNLDGTSGELLLIASLRRERGGKGWLSRLFRSADLEIGVEDFDELVRIEVEPEYESALVELLQVDGAREAISWLVERHVGVSITGTSIIAGGRYWNSNNRPPLEAVSLHGMAIGIHWLRTRRVLLGGTGAM